MTEPGRIDATISLEIRRGAGRPEINAVGDDDVLFLDVLGHQRRLLGLILLRHFLRVSARGLRVLELFILDRRNFAPRTLDLLLRCGTNIGRRNDCAKPPRGRDGLQAGDADAHDEHLRGRNRSGSSHHHGQRAAVFFGAASITAR